MKFTHISLGVFLLYLITNNLIIGEIALNCNFSSMIGFESFRLLHPVAFQDIIGDMNYIIFCGLDLLIHIIPSIFLLYYIIEVSNYLYLITFGFHLLWAYFTVKSLNLNKIYLNNVILTDKQWIKLWSIAFIGHLMPFSIKIFNLV